MFSDIISNNKKALRAFVGDEGKDQGLGLRQNSLSSGLPVD